MWWSDIESGLWGVFVDCFVFVMFCWWYFVGDILLVMIGFGLLDWDNWFGIFECWWLGLDDLGLNELGLYELGLCEFRLCELGLKIKWVGVGR